MDTIRKIGWADLGSWTAALASLLPLWLLSAVMAGEIAVAAIPLAAVVCVALLRKGWMTLELVLYSLFPLTLIFLLDEMSMIYKAPLILLCALLLTMGIFGYQRSLFHDRIGLAWLILLAACIATWYFCRYATQNYWQVAGDWDLFKCLPGTPGCSLSGDLPPWWTVFFK